MKLLVVAGHGRLPSGVMDNGAGGHGFNEAERVRALASRMKHFGGASVDIGNTAINWYGYKTFQSFNAAGYDAVIELHLDSSSSASANGGHIIIKLGFGADKWDSALASFIGGYFPGRSSKIVG
ncbi:hypothetical protein [Enterococcus larvae]|uniref:hypothetical protein n=1 Tax=Enterococcus larvae TaxID=2794352 RepID=UPI003F410FD5